MDAPNFVIEVLSPGSTDEMLDRQDICSDNGCEVFWTVDPKRKTVLVTTADRRPVTYSQAISTAVPYTEKFVEVSRIFS